MKIEHISKNESITSIEGLYGLGKIAKYTHEHYDPMNFTCKEICEELAGMFDNLIPVEVDMLLCRGEIRCKGHWVCKVKDTNYIIDPTGDQFDYTVDEDPEESSSTIRLTNQVTPWIYIRNGKWYMSMNHFPYNSDKNLSICSDVDLLNATKYPFNSDLKCLFIED